MCGGQNIVKPKASVQFRFSLPVSPEDFSFSLTIFSPCNRISSPREGEGEGERHNLMAEDNAAGGERFLFRFDYCFPMRDRLSSPREGEGEGERHNLMAEDNVAGGERFLFQFDYCFPMRDRISSPREGEREEMEAG